MARITGSAAVGQIAPRDAPRHCCSSGGGPEQAGPPGRCSCLLGPAGGAASAVAGWVIIRVVIMIGAAGFGTGCGGGRPGAWGPGLGLRAAGTYFSLTVTAASGLGVI